MRLLAGVFSAALLLSAPAHAGPLEPTAELQVGDAVAPRAVQPGQLIYYSGALGESDDSRPPIEWPDAIPIHRGEPLQITVADPMLPSSVELMMWRGIRANGIPKGRIGHLDCLVDPTSLDDCRIGPDTAADGSPGWAATLDGPGSAKQVYVAASFGWDAYVTSQAVWLFHFKLRV